MSTYISTVNFYQLPDANVVSQNQALNAVLATNKTGRTSAGGVYFKYDKSKADNIDRPLSDPYEVCLKGQDWNYKDNNTNYVITDNLTPGTGKTTVGCIGTGPLSSISDIRVSKEFSCNSKERRIKSMIFPLAYETMNNKKDPSKEAMHSFGVTDDAALCITDDVLNANRIVDFILTRGGCPSGYTTDLNQMNGFTLCKKYGPKPTADVIAKYQKIIDDAEAEQEAELIAVEEEAFAELSLIDKIKTSKNYQLCTVFITLGTVILIFCLSMSSVLSMQSDDTPSFAPP